MSDFYSNCSINMGGFKHIKIIRFEGSLNEFDQGLDFEVIG